MAIQGKLRNQRDLRLYVGFNDNVNDLSPYGNDGTWNGSSGTRYASGQHGNAGIFNGTDDYVSVPNMASLNLINKYDITISAWINKDAIGPNNVVIAKNTSSNLGYNLQTTDRIQFWGINNCPQSGPSSLSAETWTHIAVVVRGNQIRFYKNGVFQEADTVLGGRNSNSTNELRIGHRSDTSSSDFAGEIDDIRLYARPFTDSEVMSLYLLSNPPAPEAKKELLFYENFQGNLNDDWIVQSGSFATKYDSSLNEYYLESLAAGVIGIPEPSEMRDLTVGGFEWEFDFYKSDTSESLVVMFISNFLGLKTAIQQDAYHYSFGSDEGIYLVERNGGVSNVLSQTVASFANLSQWYTAKVTRSSSGAFTIYLDNVLVDVTGGGGSNPVTDTTIQSTRFFTVDCLTSGTRIKNIKIRRF